jgi:hypothetical protein
MNELFGADWPCAIVVCASLLVRGMLPAPSGLMHLH